MRATDLLNTLGRPIAYYPKLAKVFGGITASILFGQLFYWSDKTDNELGVYKTSQDIEDETGLTYREQQTARKKLVELGVLIETNKRLEHKICFKINFELVDNLLDLANEQMCSPRNDKSAVRGETNINDGLSIVTKTGEKKEAVYDFKFVCDSKTINERNRKKRNPVSFEELYRVNLPIINSVFRG